MLLLDTHWCDSSVDKMSRLLNDAQMTILVNKGNRLIINHIMSKINGVFLVWLLIVLCRSDPEGCQKFVDQLVNSIVTVNFSSIPPPSVMYSGITTNNPGQKLECEEAGFHYFLVSIHNSTVNSDVFTGICVSPECSREDIEVDLEFLDCKVYEFFPQDSPDALQISGLAVLGTWVLILTVWSIILSCREPQNNEYLKEETGRNNNSGKSEEQVVNSLVQVTGNVHEDFKLFDFYQGYSRIFKRPKRKNIMALIVALATLSSLLSTEFSYRQTVAANQLKTYNFFNSILGVLLCNTEIAFTVLVYILGLKLAYSVYKQRSFHQMGRFFFDELLNKWVLLVLLTMFVYGIMGLIDQPLSKIWSINYGQDCPTVMWQMWFLFRNLQMDCKVCLPWFWLLQSELLLTIFAAPFIIIFRIHKILGYGLLMLIIFASTIVGYAILDNQGVIFEPYKLFNMQSQYVIAYQSSTVVRAAPFFLGLIVGLIIIQGLEKLEQEKRKPEYVLAKQVRRSIITQYICHAIGITLMVLAYNLIVPYLSIVDPKESQASAYTFLTLCPLCFLIGLTIFVLPSFWQGESKLTVLLNTVLGWNFWNHIDKISMNLFLLGPAVIGFTTYSLQNSIYFDFETVITYFFGDIVIIYVLSLLATAAIQNQINFLSKWLQNKVFGNQSKYSVLVIED